MQSMASSEEYPIRDAAAVLLTRGGQVWLGQRGNTRFLPGFSVFPGGGAEPDEEPPETAIRELLEETGLSLGAERLQPFARAVTPAYSPYRFDVRVYLAELGPAEEPQPDGRELVAGRWFEGRELFKAWARGELQLAPPTLRQLEHWKALSTQSAPWPNHDQAFELPPFRHQQVLPMGEALTLVPLHTRSMPPAAWTNAALLGSEKLYVLDPGGPDVSVLQEELQSRLRAGAQLAGVLLSHHHPDHICGYHALECGHVPLYCHPITAELLPQDFPAPLHLLDRQTLDLGRGKELVAHFTPGHAPGHLAFEMPHTRAVLAGDMISSLSSIVIPSDNGDLRHYLDSLNRLRALNCNLVVPAHGPPYGAGADPFGQAILHRQKREEQVLAVARKHPQTPEEITHTLYRGLDSRLFPAARANVLHHLWKLRDEGLVAEDEQGRFGTSGR